MTVTGIGGKLAAKVGDGVLDRSLFEIGGTSVSWATVVTIVLVVSATAIAATLLAALLGRVLRQSGKAGEGEIRALQRVVRYALWIIGASIALSTSGIDLDALFAAGAVFAVAIGFAMQTIVQNFVAGVILLLERAIKPGDILEVDGQVVKVVRMGVRTTVARTLDDEDLIIPNSILVQSPVKNFTLRDPEYRVRARVGVAYSSNMNLVRETLLDAARALPWRLPQNEPRVLLLEFVSSSVDWEISVWVDEPWRMRSLRSELQLAVWGAFQSAGIAIAFPQLDVHLDRRAEVDSRRGAYVGRPGRIERGLAPRGCGTISRCSSPDRTARSPDFSAGSASRGSGGGAPRFPSSAVGTLNRSFPGRRRKS